MIIRDLFADYPLSDQSVIPIAVQKLLQEPLNVHDDWSRAEQLLRSACDMFPEGLEVKVALFKMLAYSNQLDQALQLIEQVLEQAAQKAGFNSNWESLSEASHSWYPAQGPTRIYLYTLKANGFVWLRKGEPLKAHRVLTKLLELDVMDQVGGSVVMAMAMRLLDLDDVDEDDLERVSG